MNITKLGHGDFQPQDEPEVSIDYLREKMPELVQAVLDDRSLVWRNTDVRFEECFEDAMVKLCPSEYWGRTAAELKTSMDKLVASEIESQIDAALVYEECLPWGWE